MDRKTLKDSLKLDIMSLDTACLEQASLYEEMGEDWAEAVAERDRVKERLTAKRAEIDEDVRKYPEKYNSGDKITETWIGNKVAQDAEVITLNDELITCQYNVNMLSTGKESIEHRGNALKFLIDLFKGNYFAASSRRFPGNAEAAAVSQDEQGKAMDDHPRLLKRRIQKDGQSS